MSESSFSPIWNIYTPSYAIDTSTEEWEYSEYREQNSTNGTNYRMVMTDIDSFCYPAEAQLGFKVTCASSAGNLDDTYYIGLANDIMHLFEDAELLFDNVSVCPKLKRPGMVHLVRSLIEYSKDYAETVAQNHFFHPDTAGDLGVNTTVVDSGFVIAPTITTPGGNVVNIAAPASHASGMYHEFKVCGVSGAYIGGILTDDNITANGGNTILTGSTVIQSIYKNPNYNKGFYERVNRCRNRAASSNLGGAGNEIHILFPVNELFPLLKDFNKVIRGVKVELRLTKVPDNQSARYFFGYATNVGGAARTYSTTISDMSLWMPRLRPSPLALGYIEKLFSNTPDTKQSIVYRDYELVEATSKDLNGNASNVPFNWRIGSQLARPTQVAIVFQLNTRDTDYALNPAQFDHIADRITLRVNSKVFPKEEYTLTQRNFVRAVHEAHRMANKHNDYADSSLITVSNFRNIYPVYVFNLEHLEEGIYKNVSGRIELDLRASLNNIYGANPITINTYAIITAEKEMTFDSINGEMKFVKS